MNRKPFLQNVLLISVLAVTAFILSAQARKNDTGKRESAALKETHVSEAPPSAADNAEGLAELDKIAGRYENKNLYLAGEILFYANADSMAVSPERTSFTSINTPLGSSYEIDSVQTITSQHITIMVDKREKSMAITERDTAPEQFDFQKIVSEELSLFREYISSIKVVSAGTGKKLVVKFKEDSPANTGNYEIEYEPESYRIKKVRMEIFNGEITDMNEDQDEGDELVFDDENSNEISTGYYAKVKTSVYEVIYKAERKADAELVNINHFVTKTGDGYIPAGTFKHYQLLN